MKVLIIGGTNFIGPPVIRYLAAAGHQMMIFNRGQTQVKLPHRVERLLGDRHHLREYRAQIKAFAPDIVLDMIPYTQTEAETVLETIQGFCDRVVAISSQDVYRARDIIWGLESNGVDPTPLTESAPLRSRYYPYRDASPLGLPPDYDKILVEQAYLNSPDVQVTLLRLPMVYGPGDPLHRFAAYLHRLNADRPAILLEASLANWRSSYSYVDNVAWGIALAVIQPQPHDCIFNISELNPLSEAEQLALLGTLANWSGQVIAVSRDHLPDTWHFPFNMQQDWVTDSTQIRQILGYQEPIDRTEALKRTLDWERSHPLTDVSQSASAMAILEEDIENTILKAMGLL
ncbi:MAG: NAD-dependent epimerase/dehydratase family protein [Leptolyngbya sp. SIO1D8]|nr:NAD-dependent epimerase/dehydratase family protein [Leptolyngbya sp. SIO1D8]